MSKKSILVAICLLVAQLIKAQNTVYQYPADNLREEKITQLLNNSRKNGVQEWEINKLNLALHNRLNGQKNANQRTIVNPPQVNSNACVNAGFETGTTSGWAFFSGDVNAVNLPCNACAITAGAITSVVNDTSTRTSQCTSGVDKYGGFPVVAPTPFGGNYSLLLNDATAGGKIQRASYTFVVDNATDLFTFQYAVILQSGGHPANQQPYFHVDVTDLTTNATMPCSQYDASAPTTGPLAGWNTSPLDATVYFKSWESVNIDLQSAIGHTVSVNFIVSDCSQGGHFGYCYIDAACGNINLSNTINLPSACDTTASVIINAPYGYSSYQWFGPNQPYNAIAGGTLSTLTTSVTINDTFMVSGTLASGCIISYKYIISPALTIISPTDSITAGDTIIISATGAISYTWTSSDGGSYTGDSISVFPLINTTYTVVGIDSSGCTSSASRLINVANRVTNISKNGLQNQIAIYPNPANNILNIDCKLKNAMLSITDVLGNKIRQLTIENELTSLDVNSLSNGIYFLNINTSNGLITKKFVVQR
ncbi:MAG: T9SS type A sorting domain-containing protein [Bacteroidia bacterium]